MVDVELSARHRRFLDCFLCLFFAADEENLATALCHFPEKIGRKLELFHRLIEVDDVNGVPLLENEGFHFRVPPLRLMAKMDASFEQLRH